MQSTNRALYYDPNETLSHNAMISMVLSMRGLGKTFSTLEEAITRYIKKGKKFVYLRRTDAELKLCRGELFDKIELVGHFPTRHFRCQGRHILMAQDGVDGEQIIGYTMSLSTAYQFKSSGFANTDLIIFDEFLAEDGSGRYLPDEPRRLLALMETIGRMGEIRAILLANFITVANVYFDYFKVHPKRGSKFTKSKDGLVLVHFYENLQHSKEKQLTPIARLTAGTTYGQYAYENKALLDDYTFIKRKPGDCHYCYTMVINKTRIGVWFCSREDSYFISRSNDPSAISVYTFSFDDQEPNTLMMKGYRNNAHIKSLKYAVMVGKCYYEDISLQVYVRDALEYT